MRLASDDALFLDTNVLVHVFRGDNWGKEIEQEYGLSKRRFTPLLCSVVRGETIALAKYWNWGRRRLEDLEQRLDRLVQVSVALPEVIDAYAMIYVKQKRAGKPIGENDTWIAACVYAAGGVLLTADSDFEQLEVGPAIEKVIIS